MAATLTHLALRYVKERVARGELAADTARQYESRLLDFARTTNTPAGQITRRHVEQWMERPGLSIHYRRARFSVLCGFIEWCVLHSHIPTNPTLGIRPPKLPPLLPRYLSAAEMAAFLAACRTPRIRLAGLLMVQECLRRGEVARLQIGDLDLGKQLLDVRGKGGHGNITRRLPISDETHTALRIYLRIVQRSSGPLFRSERWPDRGISGAWIGELVTRAMREAGVKHYNGDGRSPHALRHTGAQDMVDAGIDLRVVQRVLGHASIKNTEWYVRGDVRGMRHAMASRSYQST